jgi:predicted nucleic acid-binding protein
MTLVDSSILIDLFNEDPQWAEWSAEALARCGEQDELAINQIIYAEIGVAFDSPEALEIAIACLKKLSLPFNAAHRAAQAFEAFRLRDGKRTSPLADFYIGAHAETDGLKLLTRDPQNIRIYFPNVQLICPDA